MALPDAGKIARVVGLVATPGTFTSRYISDGLMVVAKPDVGVAFTLLRGQFLQCTAFHHRVTFESPDPVLCPRLATEVSSTSRSALTPMLAGPLTEV